MSAQLRQSKFVLLIFCMTIMSCAPIKEPPPFNRVTGKPENSAGSEDSSCRYNVVFVPQLGNHEVLTLNEQKTYSDNELGASQIDVINYLRAESDYAVFAEQLGQTISIEDELRSRYLATIKNYHEVFPLGVPRALTSLSQAQLELLIKNGGAYASLMTEERESLNGVTLTQQIYDNQKAGIETALNEHLLDGKRRPVELGTDLYKKFYFDRERSALTQIRDYVLANPRTTRVILVHNSKLNFARHPDLLPAKCVLIPADFTVSLDQ